MVFRSVVVASVLFFLIMISLTNTLLAEESKSNASSNDDGSNKSDELIFGMDRTQLLIAFVMVMVIVIMLGLIIYRILYLRKRRITIGQEEVDPFTKEYGIYTKDYDKELITLKVDQSMEKIEKRLKASLSVDGIYLETAQKGKRSRRK